MATGLVLRVRSSFETRAHRAQALALAVMAHKGDKFDMAGLMALADEYLAYIEGDDAAPIPRPDLNGAKK